MSVMFINPGAGPCERGTIDQAYENMRKLLADAGCPDAPFRRDPDPDAEDDDGRFAFLVTLHGKDVSVLMPALGIRKVRWLSSSSGSIWDFPRLYVDGSSWIWKFAVEIIGERSRCPACANGEDHDECPEVQP